MHEEIAGPVYAVFAGGLDLRERLERHPELLDFPKEQAGLKEILRKVPNIGEERFGSEAFLGIRYPLVCWLDEVFILNSPWKSEWTEASLEMSLYDSRDRAWKFWEQAQLAESRVSVDVLEVFFLCVMLGFRGDWHNKPDRLDDWQTATRRLLFDNQKRRWPAPAEVQATTYVPPLTGAARRQTMLLAWAGSMLVFILVAMFLFITFISRLRRWGGFAACGLEFPHC
jgi:type VI secretion system protein ImpK